MEWTMGIEVDGSDSRALQIAPETHWPQMRVLILVVSTSGSSVENSQSKTHFVFNLIMCFVAKILVRLDKIKPVFAVLVFSF